MERSNTRRDFLLGAVFFGALALLLYYTIVLTGFSLQEKIYREAWFPNAAGLKEGDSVLVAGRQTGTVRAVSYHDGRAEDRRIQVRMEFEEPVTLHPGYSIRISEFTVLGGRVVEIDPGPPGAGPLPTEAELIGTVGSSAIAELGELLENNRSKIDEIIENLRVTSGDLRDGRGPLGALIHDEELRTELENFIDAAGRLGRDVDAGEGVLGLLTRDQEARDRLEAMIADATDAVARIEEVASQIAAGEGLAGAIVYDEQLEADTLALVADLRASSSELRASLERANRGEGLLGTLLTDPTLAEDASAFLANLRATTDRIERGEGAIGKLLTEDIAYDELVKALRLLTSILEDVREAQPVSSFAGLLFGTSF